MVPWSAGIMLYWRSMYQTFCGMWLASWAEATPSPRNRPSNCSAVSTATATAVRKFCVVIFIIPRRVRDRVTAGSSRRWVCFVKLEIETLAQTLAASRSRSRSTRWFPLFGEEVLVLPCCRTFVHCSHILEWYEFLFSIGRLSFFFHCFLKSFFGCIEWLNRIKYETFY